MGQILKEKQVAVVVDVKQSVEIFSNLADHWESLCYYKSNR